VQDICFSCGNKIKGKGFKRNIIQSSIFALLIFLSQISQIIVYAVTDSSKAKALVTGIAFLVTLLSAFLLLGSLISIFIFAKYPLLKTVGAIKVFTFSAGVFIFFAIAMINGYTETSVASYEPYVFAALALVTFVCGIVYVIMLVKRAEKVRRAIYNINKRI
jgi:peptidoglycan/LPS O-acetylase OafA/YrhL